MLLGAKCSRGPPRLPRIDPRFVRSIDRGNLGGFRNLTATFLETGTEPWATNRSSPAGASHESGRRLSCYRFGTGMGATSFGVLSRSRSPAEICLPIPLSPVSREAVGKRFVRGGLETRSSRKRLSGGYRVGADPTEDAAVVPVPTAGDAGQNGRGNPRQELSVLS